ncbi:hypothetical protein HYX06_05110 [Candidatus Woesearchaeota archaeon]|nr:hypothetical protein [Candidatus Woesearchaeota archaeon]
MNELELNQLFIKLSKEYGLNPSFLRQIIPLRNAGYNNSQISEITGISRVTVNTYLDKFTQIETQENFKKLIVTGLVLYAGYQIIKELFKE